jgi:hypothetical protein
MLLDAVGSVTVHDEPDLLLINQDSLAVTVKFAVLVTGAVDAAAIAALIADMSN